MDLDQGVGGHLAILKSLMERAQVAVQGLIHILMGQRSEAFSVLALTVLCLYLAGPTVS